MHLKDKFRKDSPSIPSHHASDLMPTDERSVRILNERAAVLAKVEDATGDKGHTLNYIQFRLGDNEYYGISYQFTREVLENINFTPLPCTHNCIVGVINWRGVLLPLLGLNQFLGTKTPSTSKEMSIIIIEGNRTTLGLVVDYIVGTDTYDACELSNSYPYEGVMDNKYFLGLHQGKIAILNVDAILVDLHQQLKRD